MALKRKLTAAEHAALPDVLKAEYKADGANFVLDTDDATDLISARDREKEAARAAKAELAETKRLLDEATDKKNREAGDVAALDLSYKAKITALEEKAAASEAKANKVLRDVHVNDVAGKIAAKFTVPSLVREQITKRLQVEMHDDAAVVRVVDATGKPTALSVADLEKEFVDNPEFKSIVIASKASGSAQAGQHNNPGSAGLLTSPDGKPKLLSSMTPKELAEYAKASDTVTREDA